ncbi:helix-turn-helix domain-containing protein [Prescottella equi]
MNKPNDQGRIREKLDLSVLEALKNKGMSQSDIARAFGVTRQHVSWVKKRYGGKLTPREEVLQHFPWEVATAFTQTSPYRRLRDHAEYMATGGVGMSDDKLSRLRAFYKRLRDADVVVEFDPSLPPIKGVSNKGGFALRPRTDEDDDLLIRVNEYTNLTDKGRLIWRFPPREP